jgi:hypothetical protein
MDDNKTPNETLSLSNKLSGAREISIAALKITQHLDFVPYIGSITKLGLEIIDLYEKAKNNVASN